MNKAFLDIASKLISDTSFRMNHINPSKLVSELTNKLATYTIKTEADAWKFALFAYYYMLTNLVLHYDINDIAKYSNDDRNNFHWNDYLDGKWDVYDIYEAICKDFKLEPKEF